MNAPPPSDGRRYETHDASLRWVIASAVALALLCLLGLALGEGTFELLAGRADARQVEPHPLATPDERAPGPQLQSNPPREFAEYLAGQRDAAESYGWIDPEAGIVRLPQERALELVLGEGLPSRPRVEGEGR